MLLIRQNDPSKLNRKAFCIEDKGRAWNEMSGEIPSDLLPVFVGSNLKPEWLQLVIGTIYDPRRNANDLTTILRAHTLKELNLKMCFGADPEDVMDSFETFMLADSGQFMNLEKLVLTNKVFTSMAFLNFVPILKTLELQYDCTQMIRETSSADMPSIQLCSCIEFKAPEMYHGFEIEDLQKLINWLPNVHKLEISALNSEMFARICQRWPKKLIINISQDFQGMERSPETFERAMSMAATDNRKRCSYNRKHKPCTLV